MTGIPYPTFNPIWFEIPIPFAGTALPIRWYALAYIAGLLLGWVYARALVKRDTLWGGVPRPTVLQIDDLLVYAAFGTIVGGRLGDVLFYDYDIYLAHPLEIFMLWHGGMAFHGGLLGVAIAIWLFARRFQLPVLVVFDICAAVVPLGLFFGRIANFIKPELWGRVTTMPWGMVFLDPVTKMPVAGNLPRHPSQLYEAGLEGVALFIILAMAVRRGALRRPGTVAGLFGIGYALARIFVDLYRDPESSGPLGSWFTMGMALSIPMILVGLALIWNANRRAGAQHA
jgi:phosphatidylglycerol:prolipoprotein diacylglycerol transferase